MSLSPWDGILGAKSFGGDPEGARARSAGGLYLPKRSSAWISRALWCHHLTTPRMPKNVAYLFAKAAEGAGGGVLPEETLE